MSFLEKLDDLLQINKLNKNTLSKACDIPYTTIDGWYKKGYEGLKLTTLRKLSDYFCVPLDFWVNDNILDEFNPLKSIKNSSDLFDKSEEQLVGIYRQLSEEGQEKLLDNADDMLASGKYTKSTNAEFSKEFDIQEDMIKTLKELSVMPTAKLTKQK